MTHVHMSQPLRPSRFVHGPDAKEGEANSEEKQFQPLTARFVKSRDSDQPLKSAFVAQAAALSLFFFSRAWRALNADPRCLSGGWRVSDSIRQYQISVVHLARVKARKGVGQPSIVLWA